ncbi:PQQ-dependent sugar dehydrogenase [Idiomarina sp. HP20-50]|uniref:PQQ-dependent sugar dehydrogenase n=1 Tax=Idiomarina sp. HP20-50 TaxID=3070813 RepID=UPI00294B7DDE|nr:PQQ-dependent sugar dehydrogenase [Idiomarina sp. HP20-50]MDV6317346.1 PQQ-dependent sugar dehydrogenase [Idiomarina sp. HP20-50]
MFNPKFIFTAMLAASMSTAATAETVETERHTVSITTLADGFTHPWGMAFLPNGNMLVTERSGNLYWLSEDGSKRKKISDVPEVVAQGQGGLLDVVVDPNYSENGWVYISYSEAAAEGKGNSTAVMRAKISDNSFTDKEVIFRQAPKYESTAHFGSRLAFSPEGHLYITLGDRYSRMEDAQTLDNHHGKIVRIWPDGSIPKDNPFVGNDQALDEIWSYGHRNVQGADIHPDTGELWSVEHGPQGGDEVNIPKAGKNYGWPEVTYGVDYGGAIISDVAVKEGTEQPFYYWVPSIATAGATFYTGDAFPEWKGDFFVAALKSSLVARLDLYEGRMMHEERLFEDAIDARIRDINQGPDGYLYLLTDQPNGAVIQIKPTD